VSEATTLQGELLGTLRRWVGGTALGVLILAALVAVVVLQGREALAQDAKAAAVQATSDVRSDVVAVKARQVASEEAQAAQQRRIEDIERRVANVERTTLETNANVTLVVKAMGLRPVRVDAETDGGAR